MSQRTREIAVRVALGAHARNVIASVIAHGLVLTGIGLAIGLLAALAATRLLTSPLYQVSPRDA